MAGQLSQSERVAEFKTPLGENVLALIKLDGSEVLGDMFQFNIEALSEKENIDFDKALGQGCMLKLDAYEKKKRIYHGVMTEAQWIGKIEDFFHYRITLRPWFWLLGHKADCRIFLDKDVKDIIKDVFDKAGFHDYEFRTNGDYEKIPYCVQYRETDLAFVSRLMELYGIYYFFEHSERKASDGAGRLCARRTSPSRVCPRYPSFRWPKRSSGRASICTAGFRTGVFAPERSSSTTMTI